ncbi:hypothetical protein DHEL01_v200601 [Diaporthe helianthi]|uniref:2EXR domain-containing protein n=1 Tax=Diaporthe helianthi TaxID=158607 RepID=A0A2P5IEW5_DIAHE|nr:hypothetical protein DHEL01_v200601 [Diaporthe helianthi]
MNSAMMDFNTPTDFLFFPFLPAWIRQMVWDEALPTLYIQRFNAEVARNQDHPLANGSGGLTLCLTPNDDFVQLTKGYVGLLGACQESRAAAQIKIEGYLPIQYIAQDQDGSISIRFAKVPYNPDGQVCISGISPAMHLASEGLGARGTSLAMARNDPADVIAYNIRCVTIPEIKNLAIALDLPRGYVDERSIMSGWDFHCYNHLASRMAAYKLETMELVEEGWLDERHDYEDHPEYFAYLHMPAPLLSSVAVAPNVRPRVQMPWTRLLDDFMAKRTALRTIRNRRGSGSGQ